MSDLNNAIREKTKLIGTLLSVPSPALAEAISQTRVDWIFFDLEHSTISLSSAQTMIQAIRPACLSLVRIAEPLPVYVKQALDTGCSGIIVPQVNSAELARQVVQAGKFPPLGSRSVGLSRSCGYGANLKDSIANDNQRTSIIVQIEHINAIACVDEIAATDGVDALFVGPYDLSGSLGIPGEISDSRVQSAIDVAIKAASAANKPIGIFVGTAEAAKKELDRGFDFVAVGSDLLHLTGSVNRMYEAIRS